MNPSTNKPAAASHTPGPWSIHWSIGDFHNIMAIDEDFHPVAKVLDHAPTDGDMEAEAKANARLIAAAPNLLEALEAIRRDCVEVLEGREPLNIDLIHAIANGKARSAIAKARDQQ